MTTPSAPNVFSGIGTIVRFQALRIVRGNKLRLGVIAVVLVVAAVIAARYIAEDPDPKTVFRGGIDLGFFTLLVYLLPFLFTSGALAEEIEGRTFPYLASRPVGRFAIAVGKFLAGAGASVGLTAVGILALHIGCYATDPTPLVDEFPATLRVMGASSLLVTAYAAICMMWGAFLPEAAGIVATLYLGIIEFCFRLLPGTFRVIVMNYQAQQLAGLPKAGFLPESVPDVEPWIASLVLVGTTVLFLVIGVGITKGSEFRYGKS